MKEYVFYDTDMRGEADYDICGSDYEKLIDVCCQYGCTLSLMIANRHTKLVKHLEAFRMPQPQNIRNEYMRYSQNSDGSDLDIRYYHVCDELCSLLKASANSIFDWVYEQGHKNPEDPIFYRADGSKFFLSVIHEGELELYVNDSEDISAILDSIGFKLQQK